MLCSVRTILISFSDICGSSCHCICGYALTIPPPHTLPYYPRTKHPTCPLSQLKNIGGGLPHSMIDARWRKLRLASESADSVCIRAHRYLHHVPPRPHTWLRTLTTSFHATALHSHMFPARTAPPHSHLYFGYKLPVRHVSPGLVTAQVGVSSVSLFDSHFKQSRFH